MTKLIEFPAPAEYPAYAEAYMQFLKKDGSLLRQLKKNFRRVKKMVRKVSDSDLNFRYAEGKWTLKEVLVHIIDDERVFACRALAFARNDKTELPGFEQDDYIQYADVSDRPIGNILKEYKAVRKATIALFKGFSDVSLLRSGTANGHKASVRALGYHIAGHELHHLNIIKEKYLKK